MIVSHTLVKNGMPFIDLVLRQVIPYVNRCLITISEKSNDGTLRVLRELEKEFKNKIFIEFEDVSKVRYLTQERQKQVNKTFEDWILFLDDDDYWPTESLEEIMEKIKKNEDVDGYSVDPYQIIDPRHYDLSWTNKSFTKWFRKTSDIHYTGWWPRDLIFKGESCLYWKRNSRVLRIDTKFLHLSYIKKHSFRTEEWAKVFAHRVGTPQEIPDKHKKDIEIIYDQIVKYDKVR